MHVYYAVEHWPVIKALFAGEKNNNGRVSVNRLLKEEFFVNSNNCFR